MFKKILVLILITFTLTYSYSYVNNVSDAFTNKDTTKLQCLEIINEVNQKSLKINNIHSENIIKIKTSTFEQTGNLEIRLKKMDDLWLRISGSFAIIEKDAIFAYFNKEKFIYYDNLKEIVIEGFTNDSNITYLTRIKCSYEDLMNVMSNTVYISYNERDSVNKRETDSSIILGISGENVRIEYLINKAFKYVTRYSYFDSENNELLRISFQNYALQSNGFYAKQIEIYKPRRNEYLKIFNTEFNSDVLDLDFEIKIPEDAKRIERW